MAVDDNLIKAFTKLNSGKPLTKRQEKELREELRDKRFDVYDEIHICDEYIEVNDSEWSQVFKVVKRDEQWFLYVSGIEGQDGDVRIKACPFCGKFL